jgi:pimeloyl-ACP methyl ester carboxylesterase
LADRFEVIAFDWPGMGYSDEWPGGATPVHLANRLLALVNYWGFETITLVGMDMGGQPALAFAAKYPDRVQHLVVMNSLVFGDEATSWEIRILRQFGWNRLILRRLPQIVFRRAEQTFLPHDIRLSDRLRTDFWGAFRDQEVRTFISKMCAGYQGTLLSLPQLYPTIKCPTLVMWGEHDKHFPPVHAQRLQAAIPGSKLQIVPRAGHWMAWTMAEALAVQILAFVAGY